MKKLTKILNIAVAMLMALSFSCCDKLEPVDFKIQGLKYKRTEDFLYKATIPAEGTEFSLQESKKKDVPARLGYMLVNGELCLEITKENATETHFEGAEWGTLDIDFNINPTIYTFRISPNDTGKTRTIEIYYITDTATKIILTQPALEQ